MDWEQVELLTCRLYGVENTEDKAPKTVALERSPASNTVRGPFATEYELSSDSWATQWTAAGAIHTHREIGLTLLG